MPLSDADLRKAKEQAARYLAANSRKPVKRLPVGVYDKGSGYLASVRMPGGGWQQKYFQTEEQAVKAREDSLKQETP